MSSSSILLSGCQFNSELGNLLLSVLYGKPNLYGNTRLNHLNLFSPIFCVMYIFKFNLFVNLMFDSHSNLDVLEDLVNYSISVSNIFFSLAFFIVQVSAPHGKILSMTDYKYFFHLIYYITSL